jgi:hypothetical protein
VTAPSILKYDEGVVKAARPHFHASPSEVHNMTEPQHERYRQYVQDPPAGFPLRGLVLNVFGAYKINNTFSFLSFWIFKRFC